MPSRAPGGADPLRSCERGMEGSRKRRKAKLFWCRR